MEVEVQVWILISESVRMHLQCCYDLQHPSSDDHIKDNIYAIMEKYAAVG